MVDRLKQDGHLVIVIHGIRDFGFWKDDLSRSLKTAHFKVARANYGRMGVFQFLLPIPYLRNLAKDEVWGQIQDSVSEFLKEYKEGKISFIAHSFGTWIVSKLLLDNKLLKAHRIIFCGSVVNRRYPLDHIRGRFTKPLLNEVGTADIWPAMADSVTLGFGSVGTFGFNVGMDDEIRDRFHNG
jgi:hypothetical protein